MPQDNRYWSLHECAWVDYVSREPESDPAPAVRPPAPRRQDDVALPTVIAAASAPDVPAT